MSSMCARTRSPPNACAGECIGVRSASLMSTQQRHVPGTGCAASTYPPSVRACGVARTRALEGAQFSLAAHCAWVHGPPPPLSLSLERLLLSRVRSFNTFWPVCACTLISHAQLASSTTFMNNTILPALVVCLAARIHSR